MSFLTINGMALPVRRGSLKTTEIEIGERGEAFDGTPWTAVRRVKAKRSFSCTPMGQAEAAFWKAILRGMGTTWHWLTDLYSDQGHPVHDSLDASWDSPSHQLTFASEPAAYIEWDLGAGFVSSYTLFAWCDGECLAYRSSDGAIFADGAEIASWAGKAILLSMTSGVFRIDNNTTSAAAIANVMVLPAALTDEMIAAISGTASFPTLPTLTLSGDVVPAAVSVFGAVTEAPIVTAKVGGVFVANAEELSVDLVEV